MKDVNCKQSCPRIKIPAEGGGEKLGKFLAGQRRSSPPHYVQTASTLNRTTSGLKPKDSNVSDVFLTCALSSSSEFNPVLILLTMQSY